MADVQEFLLTNDEYLNLILFAIFAMLVITFIVNLYTERLKFPKYLPGGIVLILGLVILISQIGKIFEKSAIDRLVFSMIAIGDGIIGLLFGLILGLIGDEKKPEKIKYNKKIEYEDY